MLGRLRARRSAVTFDAGSGAIRACQLRRRGGRLELCDALEFDLPAGEQPAGGEASPPAVGRLARLVGQGRFQGSDVTVVLAPPEVQFHTFHLPEHVLDDSPQRVLAALKWEVGREARREPQELEVRYWRLPSGHHQGLNVMAAAMCKRRATEWFEGFLDCGLHLRRLDVLPWALVRLACDTWAPQQSDLWGVLDIGFGHASLTVVVGQTPTYVRPLALSGGQWTAQLAAALDVPYAVAEQLKRAHGIRPADGAARQAGERRDGLAGAGQARLPQVFFGLLRESLDRLVRDVNRCFSYVLQNFAELNVSRLALSGGGARLNGLAEYLELQLGIPVATLCRRAADGSGGPQAGAPGGGERGLGRLEFSPAQAAAVGAALLDLEALCPRA